MTTAKINTPPIKAKILTTNNALPLQPASHDIWDKKYRLKDKHGNNQEACVNETLTRIAKTLAAIETKDKEQAKLILTSKPI
jgi:ribonucleoside-diphosphate reductase alpha chain